MQNLSCFSITKLQTMLLSTETNIYARINKEGKGCEGEEVVKEYSLLDSNWCVNHEHNRIDRWWCVNREGPCREKSQMFIRGCGGSWEGEGILEVKVVLDTERVCIILYFFFLFSSVFLVFFLFWLYLAVFSSWWEISLVVRSQATFLPVEYICARMYVLLEQVIPSNLSLKYCTCM